MIKHVLRIPKTFDVEQLLVISAPIPSLPRQPELIAARRVHVLKRGFAGLFGVPVKTVFNLVHETGAFISPVFFVPVPGAGQLRSH